jgi:hypothetical protein
MTIRSQSMAIARTVTIAAGLCVGAQPRAAAEASDAALAAQVTGKTMTRSLALWARAPKRSTR